MKHILPKYSTTVLSFIFFFVSFIPVTQAHSFDKVVHRERGWMPSVNHSPAVPPLSSVPSSLKSRRLPPINPGITSIDKNQKSSGFLSHSAAVELRQFSQNTKITIQGTIKDAKTGEPIIGATVYAEPDKTGSITNNQGVYTLSVSAGKISISITYIGYQKETREITATKSLELNLLLYKSSAQLSEIEILGGRSAENVVGAQTGITTMNITTIKKIPAFMGEVDIIKSIKLLPGVSSVGEAATGFNVRGGNVDQNLVLLDEAPVFNTSHLFGFFSIFNPDAVASMALYRGGIPAQFGSRLSSVLNVTQKEGNYQRLSGTVGIGIISGRLTLEGPIIKDKTSFIVSGRSSYSNWLLRKMPDITLRNSQASFYDLSAKLSHRFNERNQLALSVYRSTDDFGFFRDTVYQWTSTLGSLKYTHVFNNKIKLDVTGVYSNYQFNVFSKELNNETDFSNGILFKNLKADFTYSRGKHHLKFGGTLIDYQIRQGELKPNSENSQITPLMLQQENAYESGLYLNDEFKITPRLTIMPGLRFAAFTNYGAGEVYLYKPDVPKRERTITDTIQYAKGDAIASYQGLEPRLSVKFSVTENSSIKMGYNRSQQFIHLISNTVAVSPTDFWKSSNTYIKPQIGDQLSIGYFKNFNSNTIEGSVEGYVKQIQNLVDYKNGAKLFLNKTIEADLLPGKGKAYGLELSINKKAGRLTGWLNYTYSRSFISVKGSTPEETINNGAYYPTNYDKPHNVNLVSNYALSKRVSWSANFTYSTGRPITAPLSHYVINNYIVPDFSDRNQYRLPAYHRLDLSLTVIAHQNEEKNLEGSLNFSIYNAYGRKNPYSVFFKQVYGSPPKAYQLAVVGVPLPSISYDFRF